MYSLRMINRNGYEISKEFRTIKQAKEFASFYPLTSFFAWIYDKVNDEMKFQNLWKGKWQKCDNNSFVPFY